MHRCIEGLIDVGLTENEAKTYYALLRKDLFTATEISKVAKVSRSVIYEVLESLINKGFCHVIPGKKRRYGAENPKLVCEKIKSKQSKKIEKIDTISEDLYPIFKNHKINSSPLDFIEVYGTDSSIINKYMKLEEKATKSVFSLSKPPYVMNRESGLIAKHFEDNNKKLEYRSVISYESNNKELLIKDLNDFNVKSSEVRIAKELPIKLHIFDEQTVMFSLINQINFEEHITYMVVDHKDMAETLLETFNYYWENSMTIEEFLEQEK